MIQKKTFQDLMNKKNINIFAPNIRTGGGKILLFDLLKHIRKNYPELSVTVFSNRKISKELREEKSNINLNQVNSIFEHIKLLSKRIDNCLYFGNLPPMKKGENTHLYFHNIFLTNNSLFKISFSQKIKFLVSKIYIFFNARNVDNIYCQSEIVKKDFIKTYGKHKISIMPFFQIFPKSKNIKKYDFCYIASGDEHKNHSLILDSLKLLSKKNIYPSVALTVENHRKELVMKINNYKKKYSLSVYNFGECSISQVEDIYQNSKCILFPSLYETFGLPLIEAQRIDIDLLPINLPYVHEVVKPELSFEPNILDCSNKMLDYVKNYDNEKNRNFVVLVENKIDVLLNKIKEGYNV